MTAAASARTLPKRSLALACLLLALTGCKPDAAIKQGEVVDSGIKRQQGPPVDSDQTAIVNAKNDPDGGKSAPPVTSDDAGMVTGIIRFAGKAPARLKIDMSQDPACSLTSDSNYAEQYIVHDGKLGNVYVFVKNGPPNMLASAAPVSSQPVVLDQHGCQYTPHVIAVQSGGFVEFRNSDPTMHNIHTMPTVAGNQTIDVSQGPKGAPQVKQFQQPEVMMPVRCNNHPWMNAFINVSPTPFFAVTADDGKFTLSGLPAGTYTIAAVHEKMGEQDQTITVKPHARTQADFAFSAK